MAIDVLIEIQVLSIANIETHVITSLDLFILSKFPIYFILNYLLAMYVLINEP